MEVKKYTPSEEEAKHYYSGLPSTPRLIARSSATTTLWSMPTGPEAYNILKELRVVGEHPLSNGIWENQLARPFLALLGSEGVRWTSVDVVRIGIIEESFAPVVLWVGVMPATLTPADGLTVALKCKRLLEENNIIDVHIELRESMVLGCAGPRFLNPTDDNLDQTEVEVRRPLTLTLGSPICAASTRWAQGSIGFFMAEGGDSNKTLLITARHVLFPPGDSDNNNDRYEYKSPSQPRRNALLLGDGGLEKLLGSVQKAIMFADGMKVHYENLIQAIEGKEGKKKHLETCQTELSRWKWVEKKHQAFYKDVQARWRTPENRVLGHIIFSPPINASVGVDCYTEDFAVIELDPKKFDMDGFIGNAIDLGTEIGPGNFRLLMHPDPCSANSFVYPSLDNLLRVQSVVPVTEMRHQPTLDADGKPYMMVIKRGTTSDLTIGRANNIASYRRKYFKDEEPQDSMEWPIFRHNNKSAPFSRTGDSGALIVDGRGRMVGLLTGGGGGGFDDSFDITYSTPIEFLLERIAQQFPRAHLRR